MDGIVCGVAELDTTEQPSLPKVVLNNFAGGVATISDTHTNTERNTRFCVKRRIKVVLVVKDPPANAGGTRDVVSISGSGRSP